jgi:hypothetical protein
LHLPLVVFSFIMLFVCRNNHPTQISMAGILHACLLMPLGHFLKRSAWNAHSDHVVYLSSVPQTIVFDVVSFILSQYVRSMEQVDPWLMITRQESCGWSYWPIKIFFASEYFWNFDQCLHMERPWYFVIAPLLVSSRTVWRSPRTLYICSFYSVKVVAIWFASYLEEYNGT